MVEQLTLVLGEGRTCAVCGAVLVRRESERAAKFKKRKTCSWECRCALITRTQRVRPATKLCETCGNPFDPWNRDARYCSHECANKARQIQVDALPPRACVHCGKGLVQRDNEPAARFLLRTTCGRACANKMNGPKLRIDGADEPKRCVVCGSAFTRRPTEPGRHFLNRLTCSRACMGRQVAESRRVELAPKTCVICGSQFERDPARRAADHRKRETCSHECAVQLSADRRSRHFSGSPSGQRLAALPGKNCVICGVLFRPREDEPIDHFLRKRSTCSETCKVEFRARINRERQYKDSVAKTCEVCGAVFSRRPGEQLASYRRRLCCSLTCTYACRGRRRSLGTPQNPGGYPSEWGHALRTAIRERDGQCCQLCGATRGKRDLPVHHIDYNKQNCQPRNLITLCLSCHAKTNHGDREEWSALFRAMIAAEEMAA